MPNIPGFVLVAVAIATAAVLWPKPTGSRTDASIIPDRARSPSVHEILVNVDMKSLPDQEFDDQTFVFSSEPSPAKDSLREARR